MIICKKCGHQNRDSDEWCGNDGAYLEWYGEKVAEPEPSPPEPEAPPQPEPRPGLIERVKQAVVGQEPASPAPAKDAARAAADAARAASAVPSTASVAAAPAASATAAAPVSPATATAAPTQTQATAAVPSPAGRPEGEADQPSARVPTAVLPGPRRLRPSPKPVVRPSRPPSPGDLICGKCGTGNDPERNFCKHCGASLAHAIVVKAPWYRRIFARRPLGAGERPSGGGLGLGGIIFAVIKGAVAAAAILAVLAYGLAPGIRDRVNQTVLSAVSNARHQLVPENAPIYPVKVDASSFLPGHGPEMATVDLDSKKYWAANLDDKQPVLRLTFDRPVDLSKVLFTSGAADNFEAHPRPRDVHLVFSDGTSKDIPLRDQKKPQQYDLNARHVTQVEIQILSAHRSLQGTGGVALTKVEFFIR